MYGVLYDSSSVIAYTWVRQYSDNQSVNYWGPSRPTWDSYGRASVDEYTGKANCYTPPPHQYDSGRFWIYNGDGLITGSLKYGVYVAPDAKEGTYTFEFWAGKYYGTFSHVNKSINVALTKCSVLTPGQIDFGQIVSGATAPVIRDGEVSISCKGQAPAIDIYYSARTVVSGSTVSVLDMSNANGEKQGEIRGFIGTTAGSDAGCVDKSSSMIFNGAEYSLFNVSNNVSFNVPLKWVLCPVPNPGLDKGNASAELDIIWK